MKDHFQLDNLRREYIQQVFEDLEKLRQDGIYFSGDKNNGEHKEWHRTVKLFKHCWYKNGNLEGEYKVWFSDGELDQHCWFEKGKNISFPKNIKLKPGYILGGDGKYYKD